MENRGYWGTLLLLSGLLLYAACTGNRITKQLVQIDTLLQREKPDSALFELNHLRPSMLKDEGEYAYYGLLKTQTLFRLYKPVNDSLINNSIKYYQNQEDKSKLARAYYYKGSIQYVANDRTEAMNIMKEAERLIPYTDPYTAFKIYERLADMNMRQDIYTLSIAYSHQSLRYARMLHNVDWQLYSLNK